MRLQHNISPPAPGRGGSRKRKRGADDQTQGTATPVASSVVVFPSAPIPNTSGFTTFKVEPHTPSELGPEAANDDYFNAKNSKSGATNGRQRKPPRPSPLQPQHTPSPEEAQAGEEEEGYASSSSDLLPADLQVRLDETTGLVMGKTPAKVMYLLMKAKHRYAMEQNTVLAEELNLVRNDIAKEKEAKETALDELLRREIGYVVNLVSLR